MNIPEEFGSYLLLKKLAEDALGETFRAAKVGAGGIEQVVLLRVLNGKGLDGEKLWQNASGRASLHQALRSPNIGSGVDFGRVRSYPYVAYDYVSGKNLATLLAQSEARHSPIPTDHALLIVERIAQALAVAAETKFQDQRIHHGFVVPHLAMISNEGEARLLGFEIGPGLRALAASGFRDASFSPYLAPEVAAGAPPAKSDDSWSLGALLFALLTGAPLPEGPAGSHAGLVDRAILSNDGTTIPPALADLIKRSLEPRESRIADAVAWHKALSKQMIDGHFSPTTFNLAFFMHNLFRDEIERESQEMQAERKIEWRAAPAPAVVAAPTEARAASVAAGSATGASAPLRREATGVGLPPSAAGTAARGKSRTPLFAGIAAAVLLLGGGAAWYFLKGGGAPAPTTVPPPTTTPNVAVTPSPEELKAQIDTMMSQAIAAQSEQLKAQYDERLKQLQKQLEDSRRAASSSPAPSSRSAEPIPEPTTVAEAKPSPPRPSEPPPSASVPAPRPSEPVVAAAPPPTVPEPVVQKPEPTPAPAPAAPKVQVGDLVRPGPGVIPPKLVSRPDPRYPPQARRLNKSATVDVKVLIDERGRVLEAEQVGIRAGYGFDESAVEVARRAVYNAATKEGVRVKMWTTIRISFKP